MTMRCQDPGVLKLFTAEPHDPRVSGPNVKPHPETAAEMEAICRALSNATGWEFRYEAGVARSATLPQPLPDREGSKNADPSLEWSAPVNPGVGAAPGHLKMDRSARESGVPAAAAEQLGSLVAGLISEKARLEQSLCEREAELAAGVPIVVRPRAAAHLSERLSGVLKGGAQSLGCTAAAMYLLDDDTSELKLRAQWGMGTHKLMEPARPLAGALADLEALCGHAVTLEDDVMMDLWKVPEPCEAAICVPISGPTTVLGTLWFYCDAPRKFTDIETNLAEILAGRVAAELDREALVLQLQTKRGSNLSAAMADV